MRSTFGILPLALFMSLFISGANAQLPDFFRNSYVGVGVGPNYYINSRGGGLGAGAELTYGKWVLTSTGLRGQAAVQYATVTGGQSELLYYGHFDIFFDVLTALRGRNRSDLLRSWLAVGVGLVHTASGDNDFCGVAGLGLDMKISDDWRLFAELESLIHPSDFDDNKKSSLLPMLKLGASFDIAANPTRSRSRTETRVFSNDWLFQVAFGVCSFNYSGLTGFDERLSQLTPVFGFGLGKRLNNIWNIRLAVSGLYARSNEELFSYYSINGDLMLDLVGLFNRNNLNPVFTARPYVSAGVASRLDDQSHFLFSPGCGLQLVVRPRKNHEISLDGRYIVTPPRFAHVSQPQGTLSVGMATLLVGYGYTFTRSSF